MNVSAAGDAEGAIDADGTFLPGCCVFDAVKNEVRVPVAVLVTVGVPEGVTGERESDGEAERVEVALCPAAEADGGGLTGGAAETLGDGVTRI